LSDTKPSAPPQKNLPSWYGTGELLKRDDGQASASATQPLPVAPNRAATPPQPSQAGGNRGVISPSTFGSGISAVLNTINAARSAADTARGAASDIGTAAREAAKNATIRGGVAGFNATQGMVRGVEGAARTAGEAVKTGVMNLPPVQLARAGYEGAKMAVQGAQNVGRVVAQGARTAADIGTRAVSTAGKMASDVGTGLAKGIEAAGDTAKNAIFGTSEQKPPATSQPRPAGSPNQKSKNKGGSPGMEATQMENYVLPQSRKLLETGPATTITSSRGKGSLEEATRFLTKDMLRDVENIKNNR
jgi:hypothetical protein